jgi:hypothetical protein
MEDSVAPQRWNRLIIEGLVIVVSILLAFAIDAWWEDLQERRDAEDQVVRVVAELQANVEILRAQDRQLEFATEAARGFLSIMGPGDEPVSMQTIGSSMVGIFSVPTLSLNDSATQDFLSSGQLTYGRWIDVRLALTELLSRSTGAQNASLELRDMRPPMLARLQTFVSGLDVINKHPLMEAYPKSRFESDTIGLRSDIRFEGLLASYAIRMEINREFVNDVLDSHLTIIEMIANGG